MSQSINELFKRSVEQIFNNWTALQLAVEHSMGGPTSQQTAIEMMNWVTSYCLDQPDPQVEDITDTLEDILDEEFETICEDQSPKEVAHLLVKFLHYLREGNIQQFQIDYSNLPTCKIWLSQAENPTPPPPATRQQEENPPQSSSNQDMDVDPEWTVVHSKRKK